MPEAIPGTTRAGSRKGMRFIWWGGRQKQNRQIANTFDMTTTSVSPDTSPVPKYKHYQPDTDLFDPSLGRNQSKNIAFIRYIADEFSIYLASPSE
jgi:hypothetical protein